MHAIVLENLFNFAKKYEYSNEFNILDVGTGHGYIAFALYDLFQNFDRKVNILGIDIFDDLIIKS